VTPRRLRAIVDRGSVTAEFAVAIPALMLLLGFSLGAVDATLDKMRCVDAARDAALARARGDDAGPVMPPGATAVVTDDGVRVRAVVTLRTRPLGRYLPGITVTGTAVALDEPVTP
jgi:Flp pilus assembly protein TadG